jgi:hypothetical protein
MAQHVRCDRSRVKAGREIPAGTAVYAQPRGDYRPESAYMEGRDGPFGPSIPGPE